MNYDVVGFAVLATIFLVGGFVFFSRRSELLPRELLMVGLLAHIVGSQVRHEILYRFYGGVGDAVGYYGAGLNFADELWSGNLAVLGYEWWFTSVRASWWGTVFVRNVSGLVISVIGPTMRGEFLVFSMFAFAGLYFIATAAARTYPRRAARRFAWFIMLWPSLAYWPSSIGKEAVLLLGIGMVTIGYVGKAGRIRWSAVVAGGALVFAVRPHVAAALLGAVAVSHWLRSWDRLRLRQVFEGGAILVLAVLGLFAMQAAFGIAIGDLEGIQEFASQKAEKTQTGDSSIDQVPLTPAGGVQAFVNTWARPFLWEAHNATALLASLEIMLLWGFLLLNGRRIWASLKGWRRNRLLSFGLPLLVLYTLMIGLNFANLGLITRQRALAYPFLFLIITCGAPARERPTAPAGRHVRVRTGRRGRGGRPLRGVRVAGTMRTARRGDGDDAPVWSEG